MKKVKLYIATSLDGYIARPDGSVDWLESMPNPNNIDHGYQAFYDTIDTVVMGRKTYEEILGFNVPWPYEDCDSHIVTTNPRYHTSTPNTHVINTDISLAMRKLMTNKGKDIWIVGGGQLVKTFIQLNLIDMMMICIIPTILGEGIPLFSPGTKSIHFHLNEVESYETGAVMLSYQKK